MKQIAIILILVLLAALVLAFGCFFQAGQEVQKETITQTPAEEQEGGEENESKTYIDLETGWNVYESLGENMKFSFKYPEDFNLQESYEIFNRTNYTEHSLLAIGKNYDPTNEDTYCSRCLGVRVSFIPKNQDSPFNNWFEKTAKANDGYNDKCGNRKVNSQKIKVGNNNAFVQTITCPNPIEGPPCFFKTAFIDGNNKVWVFFTQITDKDNQYQQNQEQVFDEVVSTFTLK